MISNRQNMYDHQSSSSSSDFSGSESDDNAKKELKPTSRPNNCSRSYYSSSYFSSRTSSIFSDSFSFSENDDSRRRDRGLNRTRVKNCISGERRGPKYDHEDEFEVTDSYMKDRKEDVFGKDTTILYQDRFRQNNLATRKPEIETLQLQEGKNCSLKTAFNHIVLPSYYNRKAINPKKYAERLRKRKMLWKKKIDVETRVFLNYFNSNLIIRYDSKLNTYISQDENKKHVNGDCTDEKNNQPGYFWQKTTFGHDQDGKITAKFMRLMGIKSVNQGDQISEKNENKIIQKREEMFHSMESQYEAARLATHARKGAGLGFGAFQS